MFLWNILLIKTVSQEDLVEENVAWCKYSNLNLLYDN